MASWVMASWTVALPAGRPIPGTDDVDAVNAEHAVVASPAALVAPGRAGPAGGR